MINICTYLLRHTGQHWSSG